MPEFSAWLAGVKERLQNIAPVPWRHCGSGFLEDGKKRALNGLWTNDGGIIGKENAFFIASAPTDLALAVRIIEAVERLANDWERTFPRNEPSRELRAALHSAFEETKA